MFRITSMHPARVYKKSTRRRHNPNDRPCEPYSGSCPYARACSSEQTAGRMRVPASSAQKEHRRRYASVGRPATAFLGKSPLRLCLPLHHRCRGITQVSDKFIPKKICCEQQVAVYQRYKGCPNLYLLQYVTAKAAFVGAKIT